MAKFKTDAARKRWLKLQKTKKYAVGGLTNPTMYGAPGTSMYGANVIPGTDTASIVYQESDPNRLAELDQQIADTSVDPGYQITAAEELAADARKEAIATRVGSKALNVAAKEGKTQYIESLQNLSADELANLPETTEEMMGDSAGGALRQGISAFQTTRDLNKIYKGTATGADYIKAAKFGKEGVEAGSSTMRMLDLMKDTGDITKATSAVGTGAKTIAQSAGPQLIAQAATYGFDKWYDKVSDDDTLEGQANFTTEEKALSGARGAAAGVGALGTASWIAGLAGVSAANAWNPLGWAGLIAAGIGAGVTLLNRKRKAKKAGEAVEGAEQARQKDLTNLQRGRQVEALRDKQYSGFDYGGDIIRPGQYSTGGLRKYQTTGIVSAKPTDAQKQLFGIDEHSRIQNIPIYTPEVQAQLDSLTNVRRNLPVEDLFGPREAELDAQIRALRRSNIPSQYRHGGLIQKYQTEGVSESSLPQDVQDRGIMEWSNRKLFKGDGWGAKAGNWLSGDRITRELAGSLGSIHQSDEYGPLDMGYDEWASQYQSTDPTAENFNPLVNEDTYMQAAVEANPWNVVLGQDASGYAQIGVNTPYKMKLPFINQEVRLGGTFGEDFFTREAWQPGGTYGDKLPWNWDFSGFRGRTGGIRPSMYGTGGIKKYQTTGVMTDYPMLQGQPMTERQMAWHDKALGMGMFFNPSTGAYQRTQPSEAEMNTVAPIRKPFDETKMSTGAQTVVSTEQANLDPNIDVYTGNTHTYTDSQERNDLINQRLGTGEWGYNKATDQLVRLSTPIDTPADAKVITNPELRPFRAYQGLSPTPGFDALGSTTDESFKQLPQASQDLINEANKDARRVMVQKGMEDFYSNPLTYAPGMIYLGAFAGPGIATALRGGTAAAGTGGAVGSGSFGSTAVGQGLRWTGNKLLTPTRHLLNKAGTNFSNMIYNPNNAGFLTRTGQGLQGVYNTYGGVVGVPKAYLGIGEAGGEVIAGEADLGTAFGVGEDITNLAAGTHGLSSIINKGLGNFTVGEGTKIAQDFESGDYLSGVGRIGIGWLPGDQGGTNIGGDALKYSAKLGNKYLTKEDSDAALTWLGDLGEETVTNMGNLGNLLNPFSGANTPSNLGQGMPFKTGGMRSLPGGKAVNIGNGATKYIGQTHEQGGIMADPQSEVENNEVEKNVTLADGSKNPYIYSEYLNMDGSKGYKTGGMSIADKAEELARTGAPQSSFDALAIQQEKAAGRDGSRIKGTGMAKKGGFISKYQTQGLMISDKYPREWYDSIYSEDPTYDGTPLGKRRLWYTPDGAQFVSEADAVDYINRGEMAGWKEGDPSKRELTGQELFDSVFDEAGMFRPDALPDPRDANEYGLLYPGTEKTDKDKTTTSTTQGGTTQGGGKTYVSPFDSIEEERAFQDFANEQGVDTGGYGWGRKSDAAWNQLQGQWEARGAEDEEGFNFMEAVQTDLDANKSPFAPTADGGGDSYIVKDPDKDPNVTDEVEETRKEKLRRLAKESNDNGTLLKAAQFIPAIMAFNDKADTMDPAERIGGVPRVHLDRVDMSDQIAANDAQGRAVQRFIDNAGMGTAGFAARMANYAQNQGLNMAVQAEQARMNTEIQNSEATANMEVEARNRQIAESNRQARMLVDQFNTESEAATKAQRVSAVQNAASGLLTQWMDQQMLDSQERIKNAIAGQTGIMQREAITNLLANQYSDLEAGSDAYNAMFNQYYTNMYGNTQKKFGGMRNIPRYGYSTK